jgi:hypothetical protein
MTAFILDRRVRRGIHRTNTAKGCFRAGMKNPIRLDAHPGRITMALARPTSCALKTQRAAATRCNLGAIVVFNVVDT